MPDAIFTENLPSFDVSVFERVIDHGPIEDRRVLAQQLCELVNTELCTMVDRAAVMPCLARLACDADRELRETIATQLAETENLSTDLVFAIVADEDEIALPFIISNPSLTCAVQCAVLMVGEEQRCRAIASRQDLSKNAVRKIIQVGSEGVATALLRNDRVRLGHGYCRKLYNRFHGAPKVCAAMLETDYVPAEIALVHNQRSAVEMRKTAELKGWVADDRSDDYVSDNEELNALKILSGVEPDKLPEVVSVMSAQGMLTTSLLLRAGINGHLQFFEWALAYLANVSVRRVRAATTKAPKRTMQIVLRRAGIPADTHVLFTSIFKVSSASGASETEVERDAFGRALVEITLTQTAGLPDIERQRIMQILDQLSQGRTQTLVAKLSEGMAQAA